MAKKVQNEESFFLLFKFTHSLFMEAFFFFYSSFWGYMSEQITYPGEPYIVREVIDI